MQRIGARFLGLPLCLTVCLPMGLSALGCGGDSAVEFPDDCAGLTARDAIACGEARFWAVHTEDYARRPEVYDVLGPPRDTPHRTESCAILGAMEARP